MKVYEQGDIPRENLELKLKNKTKQNISMTSLERSWAAAGKNHLGLSELTSHLHQWHSESMLFNLKWPEWINWFCVYNVSLDIWSHIPRSHPVAQLSNVYLWTKPSVSCKLWQMAEKECRETGAQVISQAGQSLINFGHSIPGVVKEGIFAMALSCLKSSLSLILSRKELKGQILDIQDCLPHRDWA